MARLRKRSAAAVVVLAASVLLVFLASGYLLLQDISTLRSEHLFSNLTFFALINFCVIVLMVLVFLVAKNIVKLVLDRRRNILGSKLRTRLVLAFVGLSLVPTVLLFILSRGIVSSVMQEWFSAEIAASIDGALGVAKAHYDEIETQLERQIVLTAQGAASTLGGTAPEESSQSLARLRSFLESKLREYDFVALSVVDARGVVVLEVRDRYRLLLGFPEFDRAALLEGLGGNVTLRAEAAVNQDLIRAYAPLPRSATEAVTQLELGHQQSTKRGDRRRVADLALVATYVPSEQIDKMLSRLIDAYDDYKERRSSRRLVTSTYLLILLIATFLILVAAIWIGFYLARTLSVPIQQLAQGTQAVARGRLSHRIPEVGGDEMGILVRSFNTMTEDLEKKTGELVRRRQYMETVLGSLEVGVMSVDGRGMITTINPAAAGIIGVPESGHCIDRLASAVLPAALTEKFDEVCEELTTLKERTATATVAMHLDGRIKQIQMTVSTLVGEKKESLGAVVLLDDLTDLVNAQRMAAWQEVAKRIAHEIKNPLTPIQLSAQRMQRHFAQTNGEHPAKNLVLDSASTIVSQVETLRNLVDEFSRFARMPAPNPQPLDLNQAVLECVNIYREAHPDIRFTLSLTELPIVSVDREQISRVLINLVDNSIAAVQMRREMEKRIGGIGEIFIFTNFDSAAGVVVVTVEDDGTGIPDSEKAKLFEPYFSTKRNGTGLGLAIVNSIISDHHGTITVGDRQPRGASFKVQLPIAS